MKKRSNLSVMLRLSGLVKPLMGYMILAIFMGVVGHLCATFITVLGGYGLLSILGFENMMALKYLFMTIIIFALVRGILRYAEQACNHFIAFKLLALIRDKVFKSLRKLCPAKLEGRDKGDLISVITSDIELLEVFYAHTISPVAIAVIFSAIMCIYIAKVHLYLGLIALVAYLVVGGAVPLYISKKSGAEGKALRTKTGQLSGYVLESLRGLDETLQYGDGENRLKEINNRTEELSSHEKRMKNVTGQNMAVTNTVILGADIVMIMVSALLCSEGIIAFDGMLLSVMALMGSFGPTVALANLGSTLQNTFAAGNRVLDILEEIPVVNEVTDGKNVDFMEAKAEAVTFSYGGEIILDKAEFSAKKGEIIGIVGKSGSGKSTLLKLFMRFWDADSGKISLSGEEIIEINTKNLRNLESYMTQETHLFHDSLGANIRIAKLDASQAEIEEACKKASIHEFIMSLPKGYDTQVGELGDTLSGGEKQRIGLARAFLHDADLILLDEPTSNLDSLNEGIILKSLKESKGEKTIILVSHRPSTVRIAERIESMDSISKGSERVS